MTNGGCSESVQREILTAALRAPSAHNAQPWRLRALGQNEYLLWYALQDKLRADPDDRDGIMALGGFYETMRLAAEQRGYTVRRTFEIRTHAQGIDLARLTIAPLEESADPLAAAIDRRQANRSAYDGQPLSGELTQELSALGNLLLAPGLIAPLVSRASVMAWKDPRFVSDLRDWTRFNEVSPDGMTVDCLDLSRLDQGALKFALRRGQLPGWLARIYAQRDVRLTRASAAMAVLVTPDRRPETLFECGRKLIRSWTSINARGFAWHPMSIVIDQPTVQELSQLIQGRDGVAIYRVGHACESVPWSKRRTLEQVIAP
jgi:hypothetical protein